MAVLQNLAPVPQSSIFLGICEDGLPLLMDLRDPAPGSLLIVGDRQEENRQLLRTVVASALMLNSPAQVGVDLIVLEPEAYEDIAGTPGSVEVIDVGDGDLPHLLWHRARRASQDSAQAGRGQIRLIILEDLEPTLTRLDPESLEALHWLVTCGAARSTWVIAGFAVRHFRQVDDRLFHAFQTRLVGALPDQQFAAYLSGLPAEVTGDLEPGIQYCATIRGQVVCFWLPAFGSPAQNLAWQLHD
jgi:hypothetical protein